MYNIPVNSIMSTHRRDLRVILVEILGGFWDSQAYTKSKKVPLSFTLPIRLFNTANQAIVRE